MEEVRGEVPGGERLGKSQHQDVIRRIHVRVKDSASSGAEQRALKTLSTVGAVLLGGFAIKEATTAGIGFTLSNKEDTRVSTFIVEEFH